MADWISHKDGDSLSISSVNADLDQLEGAINSIEDYAVQPRSLHSAHLPSTVATVGSTSCVTSSKVYTNEYPGYLSDTIDTVNGWQVAGNAGKDLVVGFAPTDLADDKIAGLLIMCNINIEESSSVAAVKLQVQLADGSWASLAHTERLASDRVISACKTKLDIPIRTLVREHMLSQTVVQGARLLVSVGGLPSPLSITVGNCNLSAMIFYGKVV